MLLKHWSQIVLKFYRRDVVNESELWDDPGPKVVG